MNVKQKAAAEKAKSKAKSKAKGVAKKAVSKAATKSNTKSVRKGKNVTIQGEAMKNSFKELPSDEYSGGSSKSKKAFAIVLGIVIISILCLVFC